MNNYEASTEDLKYYKNIFENTFFEKIFNGILIKKY